ncbi:MAG: urease accessory protein UreD [Pseudomonadales bacterium]|nr:urease accessory protein UreD [Pseudomonadales bacterium]
MLAAPPPIDPPSQQPESSWRASLTAHIAYERGAYERGTYERKDYERGDYDNGRSFLKQWSHEGPLKLQRAFYPEGPTVCHLTLLHPPGGIVAGDNLSLNFQLSENAHSLITTPSAGKFYHGDKNQRLQIQNVLATLAANAILEWLPQENIIFDGANAQLDNQFILEPDALLTGWDINCLGRPAANERFENGFFKQRLQLWRKKAAAKSDKPNNNHRPSSNNPPNSNNEAAIEPLYIENSFYQGGHKHLNSKSGLQGYPVVGTFFSTHKTEHLKQIRAAITHKTCVSSASQLPDVLVCRYLGHSTEQAKTLFTRVWDIVRQEQLNRPACRPRIWNT